MSTGKEWLVLSYNVTKDNEPPVVNGCYYFANKELFMASVKTTWGKINPMLVQIIDNDNVVKVKYENKLTMQGFEMNTFYTINEVIHF